MMGDLVQRLRLRSARVFGPAIPMEAEAADRIEALEKALREARTKIELYREKYGSYFFGHTPISFKCSKRDAWPRNIPPQCLQDHPRMP